MLQIHAFPLPDFAIDLFGSLSPTQGTSKSRPGTPTFVREAFPIGGLTSFQIRDAKMHFSHYALHSSYSALFPFHCSFLSVPLLGNYVNCMHHKIMLLHLFQCKGNVIRMQQGVECYISFMGWKQQQQ